MLRFWLAVWGIQRLVFDVLGHNLEKPENIRVSTQWELVPLPPHAAAYAALDAHASRLLYMAIDSVDFAPRAPTPATITRNDADERAHELAHSNHSSSSPGMPADLRQEFDMLVHGPGATHLVFARPRVHTVNGDGQT